MPTSKAKSAPKSAADKAAPAAANPAARALKKGDHVFLVDGSGYIFRAYHALPPLTRKSDGLQVNAVLGFCNMLWKLLADMPKDDKPTHLAVVFDKSEKTFRTEMYPEYKAHRPDLPEDLRPQFPLIRDAVRAFEIPCLEQAGFEADDLIATYARLATEAGATATIVSSDKDLMQLVGNGVTMYDTMKDKRIGPAEVMEKFGVGPDKVIEVQALIGDSSDNVPGVPGIGVKTAAQLIGEYGDLETLLKRAGEIKQDKRRQTLIDNAEIARISKKLVTLDQNVPLDVPVDQLAVHEPDYKNLIAFLKAMEFTTITRRVADKSGIDASKIEADQNRATGTLPLPSPLGGEGGERSEPGEGQMAKSTPATLALEKAGVAFALHEYEYDPHAERIGMQAAEALGIEPARLLKTLMAKAGDTVVCVLAPSDREVNLKKLAAAAKAKSAAMLGAAEAERITGYHVGGISPFGQKKRVPVFIEQSALAFPRIVMNGGRRGLQVELAPADAVRVLGATVAEIC
jgi:DNA polymerase-1